MDHTMKSPLRLMRIPALGLLLPLAFGLSACGGGGGGSSSAPPSPPAPPPPVTPPPPPIADPMYLVSAPSPFTAGCDSVPATGTLYVNAEVEPYVAVDPTNTNHLVGVWQQDRWSDGGARGLMSGVSTDAGRTWSRAPIPFSRCAGGNSGNGGNYSRASDPWVTIGPTGIVYSISISFDGGIQAAGSDSAVLASRSLDGGHTWSNPATLILDGSSFFNDKEAITADPVNPSLVYAVWDRLPPGGGGPAYFARSTDSGATWEAARPIFDGGAAQQTLGNEIVVLPNGTLIDLFTLITTASNNTQTAAAEIVRSTDQGVTWSAPTKVADLLAVGTRDPETGAMVRDGADLPQMAVAPNGTLFMVWADARFSNGARDAIAITHSGDGGLTWSTPAALNGDLAAEAFEPSVHVRIDGTIAVMYYDFRNDTSDPATLPTILWLAHSTDATTWHEGAVAVPFDLDTAPNAEGLFLGDYQGLSSMGTVIEPFFVQTNSGNFNNRTDVFSAPALSVMTVFNLLARHVIGTTATAATSFIRTADFDRRITENLGHVMERREIEWREHVKQMQKQPQQR
jgi:hypothetical protein